MENEEDECTLHDFELSLDCKKPSGHRNISAKLKSLHTTKLDTTFELEITKS